MNLIWNLSSYEPCKGYTVARLAVPHLDVLGTHCASPCRTCCWTLEPMWPVRGGLEDLGMDAFENSSQESTPSGSLEEGTGEH